MAAPEYVPIDPVADPRSYKSPPRRPESWLTDRPAEVSTDGQPRGERLGNQGPDQGYALRLMRQFEGRLTLTEGEDEHDATVGCLGVALKRASLFGRAPVVHDLTVAFTVWGFLDDEPDAGLVELRRDLFEGAGHTHHYPLQRAIADTVPESTLRLAHDEVAKRHAADWRALFSK
jgi:hypothetical protein